MYLNLTIFRPKCITKDSVFPDQNCIFGCVEIYVERERKKNKKKKCKKKNLDFVLVSGERNLRGGGEL